ncbi:MAG: hypothetical protein J6V59_02350 [Alistipes sp.]|nr:hypothetical protein [Alistipes sp.]
MKRLFTMLVAATALGACCNNEGIVIDELRHESEAYERSAELASKVREAATYEEFKAAYAEIMAYEEAFRTQVGGDTYLIFLEECNYFLNEN